MTAFPGIPGRPSARIQTSSAISSSMVWPESGMAALVTVQAQARRTWASRIAGPAAVPLPPVSEEPAEPTGPQETELAAAPALAAESGPLALAGPSRSVYQVVPSFLLPWQAVTALPVLEAVSPGGRASLASAEAGLELVSALRRAFQGSMKIFR